MTDDSTDLQQLEARLANLEAQTHAQADRIGALEYSERKRKQQALLLRVGLLIAALAAFFWLRSQGSFG